MSGFPGGQSPFKKANIRKLIATLLAAALAEHEAAADPHPGYLTKAEADLLYSILAHNHDHGDLTGLADNDHPQYLLLTDIDDTPVNGVTNAPISSNWAFDHVAAADPHPGYLTQTEGDALYSATAHTHDTLANIATSTILGRVTGGSGNSEELTAAQVRTLINVENGATADQSAAEILALLVTVDGAGSGLDADLLDGQSSAYYLSRTNHTGTQLASTISDFSEAVDDRVGALLVDSTTIDFTYTDVSNTLTAIVIDNSITNGKLRDSAAVSVIGRSANSAGDPADIAAAANDTILRRTSDTVNFGAITIGMIANDLITYAKIQNVSATSRVLGRISALAGDIEELTPANLVTLILTADGAGSSLDADLLDGQQGSVYLARVNHTGTQVASTISDFSEAVDDRVAALLVAGTGVTLTYNDGAGTLTVDSDGGGFPRHVIEEDTEVASGESYVAIGPVEIDNGIYITLNDNARMAVL